MEAFLTIATLSALVIAWLAFAVWAVGLAFSVHWILGVIVLLFFLQWASNMRGKRRRAA